VGSNQPRKGSFARWCAALKGSPSPKQATRSGEKEVHDQVVRVNNMIMCQRIVNEFGLYESKVAGTMLVVVKL